MHGFLLVILRCSYTYNIIYSLFCNWQSWNNSRPKHRFMFPVRVSFQCTKVRQFLLDLNTNSRKFFRGVCLFVTYACEISIKATITFLYFKWQGTIWEWKKNPVGSLREQQFALSVFVKFNILSGHFTWQRNVIDIESPAHRHKGLETYHEQCKFCKSLSLSFC